ncbi:pyridoxal 5'-phosphate synthase [Myroides sp. WP-1]|uniref:pyridoxine/pyridoxamine 5'-phosphate oxidase n=1 Tax=Myroides sp. WP-1 TaxID=2759944 RepID=UPI0015F92D34|nr:pyridoxamine 5'-phosphate oxidase family protein [Myroides sp. WP-1]MBB1138695.1 pyridoxamine 5'-phosphate oxidase family protein [Myroides sp. WP-1]
MKEPISLFRQLYEKELKLTPVKIPSACCFTSVGLDGFPNSRFVSCKEIIDNRFIITGSKTARKGREVEENNKVSLAFWWTSTNVQVRIQGVIEELDTFSSHRYFQERNRESQVVSIVSAQGEDLINLSELEVAYTALLQQYEGKALPTPTSFAAWAVQPFRIEFLLFSEARFHERILFEYKNGEWNNRALKP